MTVLQSLVSHASPLGWRNGVWAAAVWPLLLIAIAAMGCQPALPLTTGYGSADWRKPQWEQAEAVSPRGMPGANGISMSISLAGWASPPGRGMYVAGKPITIRCVFTNQGSAPVSLLLKDHDDYHGTLSFPVGICARVTDATGAILTENEVAKDGWWSWYYHWSTMFVPMHGDYITLNPGEGVVRIVPLDEVLLGADKIRQGLKPGAYFVQLCIHDIVSNRLLIQVAAGEQPPHRP